MEAVDRIEKSSSDEDSSSSNSGFGSLNVDLDSSTPYTDATKCRKRVKHVKRPMNPFMVWSQIERRKIVETCPGMHNSQVSKMLGRAWKVLTAEQRMPFVEEAERLRLLHMQEYPNYKYKPKSRKKGTKTPEKTTVAKSPRSGSNLPLAGHPNDVIITDIRQTPKESEEASNKSTDYQLHFTIAEDFGKDVSGSSGGGLPLKKHTETPKRVEKEHSNSKKLVLKQNQVVEKQIHKRPTKRILIQEKEQTLVKIPSDFKKKMPRRKININEHFMSGVLCSFALSTDDCVGTFDRLSSTVIDNTKAVPDMIQQISKEYQQLLQSEKEATYATFDFPDSKVPEMSELIGEHWMEPNFGFEYLP